MAMTITARVSVMKDSRITGAELVMAKARCTRLRIRKAAKKIPKRPAICRFTSTEPKSNRSPKKAKGISRNR